MEELSNKINSRIEESESIEKTSVEIIDELVQGSSVATITKMITPINKITNHLFNGNNDGQNHSIEIQKKGRKKNGKLYNPVEVTYLADTIFDDKNVKISKHLNKYDLIVFSAVGTLIEDGRSSFTTKQIYEIISGGNYRTKVSQKSINDIDESLSKMASTRVTLNIEKQLSIWGADRKEMLLKLSNPQGYLLPLNSIDISMRGETTKGYIILGENVPLWTYGKLTKQVISYELSLGNIPTRESNYKKQLSATRNNVILSHSLLTRLSEKRLKESRKEGDSIISFKWIYELFKNDDKELDRKQKERIRSITEDMLQEWKKQKVFKDYAYREKITGILYYNFGDTNGKKIDAIKIFP